MDNEADFKKWFIERMIPKTAHIVYVDVSDSPGIPDTNYAHVGVEGWIEFKWLPAKVRPKQVKWFRDRVASTGKCYLVWGCMAQPGYVTVGVIRGERVPEIKGKLTEEKASRLSHLTSNFLIEYTDKDAWLWGPIKEEILTRNSR